MRYFLDTSALLKRYIPEQGSGAVDSIFSEEAERYISSMGLLECFSSLRRLHEVEKVLNQEQYQMLCASVMSDINSGTLVVTQASPSDLALAASILQNRYLTAVDGLQIAVAVGLWSDTVFVSSDQKLNRVAEEHGLRVMDPQR